MTKITKLTLSLCVLVAALTSCGSVKDVAYFQSKDKESEAKYIISQSKLYDAVIHPKDLLTVTVSAATPEKEILEPFNIGNTNVTPDGAISPYAYPSYVVSNDGEISLPILGKVKVVGLTENQAEDVIKDKLKAYLKEGISVNLRIINYKVSVVGEVNRPGICVANNGKLNIFDAIAQSGDLTIYGNRKNVKLLRELADGRKELVTLDLSQSDIISSPYYYLQQGDVLYVEPNKAKAQSSGISAGTTIWFSVASLLTSIATLVISILK
ncbi:polysaccharide biosynthesis/export family protein [Porphyromonas pogonae]|uniref:polysaccharide biosynthesis/export family protein n=1 Tax=Porphyromonas pogonae TaxID=867595 RepID=UPI002E7A258A|nr:polysaccharide biosynthesis/export family protein [Porphyromonas pogonae]